LAGEIDLTSEQAVQDLVSAVIARFGKVRKARTMTRPKTIPKLEHGIPWLDTKQMIEVDRAMMEDYRIDLVPMMENAGRCLTILTRDPFLDGSPTGKRVTVMAGSGGNGGGTLVAARRLHNWGGEVQVLLAQQADKMTPVPHHQLDILSRMAVDIVAEPTVPPPGDTAAVIVDGLIGYSLRGAPYGVTGELIEWANEQAAPILALDTPSGIDAATGKIFDPAIHATATMTLALPKVGLRAPGAAVLVGELYLADISVPPSLYARPPVGLQVGPIFAAGDVLRL
jgi:NAD(P)H-hydrate epimerase